MTAAKSATNSTSDPPSRRARRRLPRHPAQLHGPPAIASQLKFQRRRGFSTAPQAPLFTLKTHVRLTPRALQYVVKDFRERARRPSP